MTPDEEMKQALLTCFGLSAEWASKEDSRSFTYRGPSYRRRYGELSFRMQLPTKYSYGAGVALMYPKQAIYEVKATLYGLDKTVEKALEELKKGP